MGTKGDDTPGHWGGRGQRTHFAKTGNLSNRQPKVLGGGGRDTGAMKFPGRRTAIAIPVLPGGHRQCKGTKGNSEFDGKRKWLPGTKKEKITSAKHESGGTT